MLNQKLNQKKHRGSSGGSHLSRRMALKVFTFTLKAKQSLVAGLTQVMVA